jgi:hypothetical protein
MATSDKPRGESAKCTLAVSEGSKSNGKMALGCASSLTLCFDFALSLFAFLLDKVVPLFFDFAQFSPSDSASTTLSDLQLPMLLR